METGPQPYRYSGLLSILGLASLLAGLFIMLLVPEIPLAAWSIMGIGVILLGSALVLDFRRVRGAITGRRGRFGAGTTVMISVFLGIIILLNGISINNFKLIDTTALGQFTFAQQTQDVLKAVTKPVKALCFFVSEKDIYGVTTYASDLLARYRELNDSLSIEYIDPDLHPDRAHHYNIKHYQTIVFESEGKTRLVPPSEIMVFSDQGTPVALDAEHAFTSAILEVTGQAQKKVYFLTGHGEAGIDGTYSAALDGLQDDLYLVDTINLITNSTIPADCAVLAIASPRSPLTPMEVDAIDRYIKSGGQALILADPGYPDSIAQLASRWGLNLSDGTVIDTASLVDPYTGDTIKDMPLVTGDRNFFTLNTGLNIISYFPGAIGLIPQEEIPAGVEMEPLVWTSRDSWLEKDFDPAKEPVYDEGIDVKGPLAIGVVLAAPPTDGGQSSDKLVRLIIIGDSDFASDNHYTEANNSDLFLNCVNWLAEETQLISIRRNVLPFRRLVVNPDEANFINYSSLILPPLLVFIVGGIMWWRRR